MVGVVRLKASMATATMLLFLVFFFFLAIPIYIIPFWLGFGVLVNPLYVVAFILIWFFINFLIGPWLVKRSIKLRYLGSGENPWLESTVRELSEKSRVPVPKLAVVEERSPNSFVFGRTKWGATLVFHEGLLADLNKEEIEGVIGHELGHLRHNDFAIMTTLAAIPLLASKIFELIVRMATGESEDGNIVGQILGRILLLLVSLFPLLFYALSLLCLRGLSRLREHFADAYSAYLTRSPRKLQGALAKITYGLSVQPKPTSEFGVRVFYIGDPATAEREFISIIDRKERYDLDKDGVLDERELHLAMEEEAKRLGETGSRGTLSFLHRGWGKINLAFSTHPPTYRRILLLKEIEGEMISGNYDDKRIYEQV